MYKKISWIIGIFLVIVLIIFVGFRSNFNILIKNNVPGSLNLDLKKLQGYEEQEYEDINLCLWLQNGESVVTRNEEEYKDLINNRFQKVLDDYWNQYYDNVLQTQKERFPNRTDEEYKQLVRDVFYSIHPF